MQLLALALVVVTGRLGGEHQPERVDHIRARLRPRVALTEDARHSGIDAITQPSSPGSKTIVNAS